MEKGKVVKCRHCNLFFTYTEVDISCPFCHNVYGSVVQNDAIDTVEDAAADADEVMEEKEVAEEEVKVSKQTNKKPPKIMW